MQPRLHEIKIEFKGTREKILATTSKGDPTHTKSASIRKETGAMMLDKQRKT